MERDLKGLIDTIDQKDKAESMLERKIDSLKEEINRLKFTIREQKLLIQSLKESNYEENIIVDDDIQLLKEMIYSQRQEILKKDEKIQELQTKASETDIIVPLTGDSNQYIDEIENLNKKNSELKDQLEMYESNEENAKMIIKELSEKLESYEKELEEFRNDNEKTLSMNYQVDQSAETQDLVTKNEELRSEILDYQAQVLDLQKSLESIENASMAERERSKNIINQLKSEKEETLVDFNNLKEKVKNIENIEIKDNIITNIDDYYELERQYENQMKRLETENQTYQVELESLRNQMREFKDSGSDIKEEPGELYDIEATEIIKALKQENEQIKVEISQLTDEKLKLEQIISHDIEGNDFSSNETDENISIIIRELKEENQQLIQENREVKTRLSVKLSDEAELKKIIEELQIKIHKLKTKLEVEILEKEFDMPKEPESQLYKEYIQSLDQDGIQHTIDNLAKEIESNKSYDVKKNSLYILATFKDEKVNGLFSKLETNKNWLIRFHLIKAIEKSRNIEHREILMRLLKDKDIDVREAAKNALSKL